MDWISVLDRLPEKYHAVLIWCPEYKNIYCACIDDNGWSFFGGGCPAIHDNVTHWMPLPEPPKEDTP